MAQPTNWPVHFPASRESGGLRQTTAFYNEAAIEDYIRGTINAHALLSDATDSSMRACSISIKVTVTPID